MWPSQGLIVDAISHVQPDIYTRIKNDQRLSKYQHLFGIRLIKIYLIDSVVTIFENGSKVSFHSTLVDNHVQTNTTIFTNTSSLKCTIQFISITVRYSNLKYSKHKLKKHELFPSLKHGLKQLSSKTNNNIPLMSWSSIAISDEIQHLNWKNPLWMCVTWYVLFLTSWVLQRLIVTAANCWHLVIIVCCMIFNICS